MPAQLDCDSSSDEDSDNYGISKKYAHAGAASIEKLLQIPAEEIEKVKQQRERATLNTGLSSTDYLLSLWVNRFRAFQTHVLQKSKDSVPTGEDIQLFLPVIVKTMRPTGKDKVTYSTLMRSLEYMRKWAEFQFKDFRLTRHDLLHIIRGLLDEGVITKEPRRKKQWVTTDVVHELIRCFLQDAIKNGSPSWDYTIMKVQVILLQAICGCKSGDILLSDNGELHETFCWKDIVIREDTRDGHRVLVATFTLEFTECIKRDPQHQLEHSVVEFLEPSLNCLCSLKLPLVHALRTGAVKQTSWHELRQAISKRKKLIWAHPGRPVLCAVKPGPYLSLDVKKPLRARSNARILREISIVGGVVQPIIPHDIRRGAAKEVARLPADLGRVGVTESARLLLGHSFATAESGITQDYIGDLELDIWTSRVEMTVQQGTKHVLEVAAPPPKRRLAADKIDNKCAEQDRDPQDKTSRRHAAHLLHKEDLEQWRDEP
ncbi:hypothetical protein F5Y01DRAFT_328306 [Xylaria sp. FL0043]|nr:hypothetical protein F5Y01DRAFT_328306 [Xylaria sp. FL0043]